MAILPRTPSLQLDGRRALVTGASSGIGLGAATALLGAGAEVTIAARGSKRLDDALQALTKTGGRVDRAELDVADVEAVSHFIDIHDPFDVMVNSAGMARHSPALETTADDFDLVMGTNLRGAYFLTQAVARKLIQTKRPGSLINISSQMGHVGGFDRAVYCASKHAVEGFTKAMAIEWGKYNIRVNTICPTFIRTPLTESTFTSTDKMDWIKDKIKLGRAGTVEDIMGAVLYLSSDLSALVTGTALMVDGGWTAE